MVQGSFVGKSISGLERWKRCKGSSQFLFVVSIFFERFFLFFASIRLLVPSPRMLTPTVNLSSYSNDCRRRRRSEFPRRSKTSSSFLSCFFPSDLSHCFQLLRPICQARSFQIDSSTSWKAPQLCHRDSLSLSS